MWDEKNTGNNLPAQIELYADTAAGHENSYKFLFMAKAAEAPTSPTCTRKPKRS